MDGAGFKLHYVAVINARKREWKQLQLLQTSGYRMVDRRDSLITGEVIVAHTLTCLHLV